MKRGTKSLSFGVHQFLLHPFFVSVAWRLLNGKWPSWREALCCIFHDVGYLGKPDMDGPDGIRHPELGAIIVRWLLGKTWADVVLHHSRSYCRLTGADVSSLCVPDKLSIILYPDWLYLMLGRLSGEIQEYKQRMGLSTLSDAEWLAETKHAVFIWAERELRKDPARLLRLNRFARERAGRSIVGVASRN